MINLTKNKKMMKIFKKIKKIKEIIKKNKKLIIWAVMNKVWINKL